uniref:Uncharacterized protein n=1 Tax=Tanacetum cinerariifolium TaxID=118510 RepID=A0A6L2NJD5_TANCI|nr:hypothetical protein [Tanacetum cinerariifolium]
MRLKIDIRPKEATFQVVLDALALTSFYQTFVITAKVPIIYMHEFWTTISVHNSSIRFTINKKKVSLDVEIFREVLLDLRHFGDIIYLTDVSVDYLHQPCKTFATIINKCLSGKETRMDKIRLSRAQILMCMFYKKNIDYVYLLWEDFMFQIEYKEAKNANKMSYPRFTNIIIDYFMSKDQTILKRNKMFWHTARDDTMFTAMRYISRHKDTQKTPKPKYVRKKADSDTYPKQKPIQATKGTRLNTKAKVAKSKKKKQPLRVPDEQHLKMTGADEGIVTIPGVPDVPKYESKSEKESWGDSGEEDKDDENDSEDKSDGNDDDANDDDNQEGDDTNDDDKETDSDSTKSDRSKIPGLYDDVNVNLGNEDTDMNNADQDNEIASLMETSSRHAMAVLEIKFGFTITIPPPLLFFNPLPQQATPTPIPITSKATTSFTSLLDFFSVFKFNDRVTNLEKHLSKIKQVDQYAQDLSSIPAIVDRYIYNKLGEAINKAIQTHNLDCRKEAQDGKNESSSQPKSTYEAAASLFEFKLTKILLDKIKESKSHLTTDYKKKLYDALVESYNTDKDLFNTYDKVFTLKRSQDDRDKDRDPSSTLDRGTKTRKLRKESAHAEEPSHTVNNSGVQHDQEFDMGKNEEQPVDKELMDTSFDFSASVLNWLKIKDLTQEILIGPAFEILKGTCKSLTLEYHLKECSKATTKHIHSSQQTFPVDLRSSRPSSHPSGFFINNDLEYLKGGDLSRRYSTSVTKTKAATYEIKWIEDLVHSRKRIIVVTRLMIMKKYDYDHLEEIEVRREDQKLYKFREGDFLRLRLQDIKEMLLLLVQQKLTNLTYERYALNVALRMFTRRIAIQSDGMLDDVRSALNDIAKGIRMEYIPKRKWSRLDKQRAQVMIQDIDKQLY